MAETSFVELIERLQNNDREAIGLLVQRYGRALRRAIDRALFERQLGPGPSRGGDREGSDIFQTVLLVFLARLERSRHDPGPGAELSFETPGHLVAYLKAIAGNEIKRVRRRGRIAIEGEYRHDHASGPHEGAGAPRGLASLAASPEPSPSQGLIAELLERDQAVLAEIERRLRPGEKAIWDLIRQELSWAEVAERLNGSAEALRKTYSRAVRRIANELGSTLKDQGHD